MPKCSSIQVVGNIFACLWDGVIAFPVHCPIGRSLDLAPSCIHISPEMHKDGRMVDYRKHKTRFLCCRADSGNFSVLVGQTVISLPSSETEPTSRKPVGARRCCSSVGSWALTVPQGGSCPPTPARGAHLGMPSSQPCHMAPVTGVADPCARALPGS